MSLIKNLVTTPIENKARKRKAEGEDDEDDEEATGGELRTRDPRTIVRSATDLQRLKLEKLMKNPEKPVIIPEKRQEKDYMSTVPTFVRNVMGSSAGAGSGEFHVYRHLRRKEYARQKAIQAKSFKEQLDEEYQQKLEENRRKAEEKTAKKRAKRLKRKEKAKMARKQQQKDGKHTKEATDGKASESESDSDSDKEGSSDKESKDEQDKACGPEEAVEKADAMVEEAPLASEDKEGEVADATQTESTEPSNSNKAAVEHSPESLRQGAAEKKANTAQEEVEAQSNSHTE